jgi:radical SAM superfamily enzyme YgiQ (UPF0313 family)
VKQLRVLLINPYTYDFSAYNFWSSPLGLLAVGSVLRQNGAHVYLIDCLRVEEGKRKTDGRGPFIKEVVEKSASLSAIPKRIRRYGISREVLRKELSCTDPPDLILVTTIMTYWYPGAKEVLATAKGSFPDAKIVLGGIYPSLCYEHARTHMIEADLIVRNNEIHRFYRYVEETFSFALAFRPSDYDPSVLPPPCYDLYDTIPFVPLLTSYGCPYRCTYCATPYLHPHIIRKDPGSVIAEIRHWFCRGVKRFVLYDDNFLYNKEVHAKPLLRAVAGLPFPVEIYNPNALNAALIDDEVAELLWRAGFQEVRLGFETINPDTQASTGGKVDLKAFERALGALTGAGFPSRVLGIYILAGLPLQRWEDVKASIDYLSPLGVRANIAEYTPIPHTPMFEEYYGLARYPIAEDPVFQNNALFPFAWEGFTEQDLSFLKQYLRAKNPHHE